MKSIQSLATSPMLRPVRLIKIRTRRVDQAVRGTLRGASNAAVHQIDNQVAVAEDRGRALLVQAMSQRDPEPCHEFVDIERLGDEVAGPGFERLDFDRDRGRI